MMLWPFRGASLLLPFVAVKTLCVFVAALLYDLVFWVDAPVGLGLGSVPHKSITDNFLIRKAPGRKN